MKLTCVASLLALWIVAPFALAQNSYLCVAELSTGFMFDKTSKAWRSARFEATRKYVVSKPRPAYSMGSLKPVWVVTEVGDEGPSMGCERDFSEYGFLECVGASAQSFKMSRKDLRFTAICARGYVGFGVPTLIDGSETTHMEIGKCSPI